MNGTQSPTIFEADMPGQLAGILHTHGDFQGAGSRKSLNDRSFSRLGLNSSHRIVEVSRRALDV